VFFGGHSRHGEHREQHHRLFPEAPPAVRAVSTGGSVSDVAVKGWLAVEQRRAARC